jgi:hypothetical protein
VLKAPEIESSTASNVLLASAFEVSVALATDSISSALFTIFSPK